METTAAFVAPDRVGAKHQSLLHFVSQGPWSDVAVLAKIVEEVLPAVAAQGPIEAWIVGDTGFAKKGVHSIGAARQYCGRLGKTDNCQIAVTLSVANHGASLPVAYRLNLPEDWAKDAARREKAHVPDDVRFQTKPDIALDHIRAALAGGLAPGVVLADPAYGTKGAFRAALTGMGLSYALGVQSNVIAWPPSLEPRPGEGRSGRARERARSRGAREPSPVTREGSGPKPVGECVARFRLARGPERNAGVALRRAAGSARSTRDRAGALAPFEWPLIDGLQAKRGRSSTGFLVVAGRRWN